MTLVVKNLHAIVKETGEEILKGVDLTIPTGEVHAIMGPNGNGKSTLVSTIMGYPAYQVTDGTVTFDGEDVLSKSVTERAQLGLFLGMQYPAEIPGVKNIDFIRQAMNARQPDGKSVPVLQFLKQLDAAKQLLQMPDDITDRYLNVGFSGGEKKRNEVLQMMMLKPKLAILDEIDSGLDIDALRIVANGINHMRTPKFSALLITHYERLLEYVQPDRVHVMVDGRIVQSGGPKLADELEKGGYAKFEQLSKDGVHE
ncbi:Fe-S cluster assembly ATPase SufC [uncultured Limosilactobacillus sp.]|uniref:Fe-S cluster assembly ATPase SufC n=1 Tax=uncultured Limosilactobacillus sp. TaxID=2837629 RepID=UPI0025E53A18|nr:Fe-S cluster assembly ATPase SufC [uncultured Limosilactobacillus sp.]